MLLLYEAARQHRVFDGVKAIKQSTRDRHNVIRYDTYLPRKLTPNYKNSISNYLYSANLSQHRNKHVTTYICVSATTLAHHRACSVHCPPPRDASNLQISATTHDSYLNQSCNYGRPLEHLHPPPRLGKEERIRAQARGQVPQQRQRGYLVVFIAVVHARRRWRSRQRLTGGKGFMVLVGSGGCGGRGGGGATLGERCSLDHLLRLPLLVLRPIPGLASREVHLQ